MARTVQYAQTIEAEVYNERLLGRNPSARAVRVLADRSRRMRLLVSEAMKSVRDRGHSAKGNEMCSGTACSREGCGLLCSREGCGLLCPDTGGLQYRRIQSSFWNYDAAGINQ